jgi:coatomer protein complex subunit gamma
MGCVFRSTGPIELTESETEYVVSYVKHVIDDHVVLEFIITNTIADQLLVDVGVSLQAAEDNNAYSVVKSIDAPKLRCGVVSRSWLVLRRNPRMECVFAAQFVAELKFHVLEVDSITGEIEGDEAGFAEEYPLEDVELTTTDFMAKARLADSDFRCAWESIDKSGEVLEKFGLHFKELESAVSAVITCLGMQCVIIS